MTAHLGRQQIRAAMYVRMPTENQNCSTDHQRAKLAEYAASAGMSIVREYADEGKSGLDLKRRIGLQRLIADVQAGEADYSVIIAYDVSRWGRFQEVDEAAYHEHTCRRAGIRVEYCAEQFQRAQLERARRALTFRPQDLLRMLRECHDRHGRITAKLIVADRSIPEPHTFARYFGSLSKAYELAGLKNVSPHQFVETKRRIKAFRQSLFSNAGSLLALAGMPAVAAHDFTLTARVNFPLRVEAATCRRADRGIPYWHIFPHPGADFTLIARFDFWNRGVLDFLIIPAAVLSAGPIYLRLKTPLPESCMRFNSLEAVFGLVPLATAHP